MTNRERRRVREFEKATAGLDPRMLVRVPQGVNPSDAILENMARTGYTGGPVLFFEGL
jgi:hypothetical protein